MKTRKISSAILILLASSSCALAAATAEEAARMTATLQTYLGSEPGVVTVTPAGDGYDIALDPTPYLKKITTPGFTAAVDAYKFNAVPKGNGEWAVKGNGPYKASFSAPDTLKMDIAIQNMDWSGTYNDTLQVFTDQKGQFTSFTINQEVLDPTTKMKTSSVSAIDSMIIKGTAKDAGNNLVDAESTVDISGIVTSSTVETPPGTDPAAGPNFSYVATVGKGSYVSTMKGGNFKPVNDLVGFFVSHPSKELLVKDQAQLKEKLLAALPIFNTVDGAGTYENVSVETPVGKFGLGSAGVSALLNGAQKEGRFGEGFAFSGLKLPDGLPLPPWSKGLIPTSLKFSFDVTGFDADAPVRKFITEMDITKPDPVPPGSEQAYLAAFAPTNGIKLTIPPGEITADLFSLSYEGTSDISFSGLPKVDATIRMTGMDKVIAQLQQAATDPTAQQGMAMLFAAKGIGKADGDSISWNVTMSPDGKLLVNGTDLSAMMGALGGPPPQQ